MHNIRHIAASCAQVVKIEDVAVVFASRRICILLDSHLHLCLHEIGTPVQIKLLEDFMKVCAGKDFRCTPTKRQEMVENACGQSSSIARVCPLAKLVDQQQASVCANVKRPRNLLQIDHES